MGNLPRVYFYIPKLLWPKSLPASPQDYWAWETDCTQRAYRSGKYSWTLQTYLYLKSIGFSCELINDLPDDGVVVTHTDFISTHFKPKPKMLLVCIQADRPRQPYAHLYLVQNVQDATQNPQAVFNRLFFGTRYYIPYWPQPGLIPRDPSRGDRFENIAYLGIKENLAPELQDPAWANQLADLGLRWHVIGPEAWNDYSCVDAIVAVRSFAYTGNYLRKPPSKLFNAWQTGIPAILGREAGFRSQRQSDLDYIEVTSVQEAIATLQRLRDDKTLRRAMVENARVRAIAVRPDNIVDQWQIFFNKIAFPAYQQWCRFGSLNRPAFLLQRYMRFKMKESVGKITDSLSPIASEDEKFRQIFWS